MSCQIIFRDFNTIVVGLYSTQEVHGPHYHDHFCSEDHDHLCEPRQVKWVDEDNTKPPPSFEAFGRPDDDVVQQYEQFYGPKPPQHKSRGHTKPDEANGNTDKDENKNDESDGNADNSSTKDGEKKESNNNVKEHDPRFEYLHIVPWQYRQSLTSETNECDSPVSGRLDPPTYSDEPDSGAFTEDDTSDDGLEALPIIVLQEIFRYLDASQLALLAVTSKHLRTVASSLLQEKGMVEMCWEKREGSWQITKKVK